MHTRRRLFASAARAFRREVTRRISPDDLPIRVVSSPPLASIPQLAHGLERVLFNPGIHFLRDQRTAVYNFDPFLRKIVQPEQFNFEQCVPPFVPPSEDARLRELAQDCRGIRYCSSTSSMSAAMSHLYFLISRMKPLNLSAFVSQAFVDEPVTFTALTRAPVSFLLKRHKGTAIQSLVAEKPVKEEPSVLSLLGQSLERLLTSSKDEFGRMLVGCADPLVAQPSSEAYNYTAAGPFLLRSQLDCHDPRLPRKSFDLKTRATLPVRMDIHNYKNYLDYRLRTLHGMFESFEREFFDMCRSTMLKYNFQVRIGGMDGIFVAYHNTAELFGFQYISQEVMDDVLYGNTRTGDAAYRLVLDTFGGVLDGVCETLAGGNSLRLTFALNRECSKLTIFATEIVESSSKSSASSQLHEDVGPVHQFELTAASTINGFKHSDAIIHLDPHGSDKWIVSTTLSAQDTADMAAYASARAKVEDRLGVAPSADTSSNGIASSMRMRDLKPSLRNSGSNASINRSIMEKVQRNSSSDELDDENKVIAPWTVIDDGLSTTAPPPSSSSPSQ